jgi:hypothetical protein
LYRISHVYNLLSISDAGLLGSRDSEKALEILVSGFLKSDKLPTLETLKQRYEDFTTGINSLAADYVEDVKSIREAKEAKRRKLTVSNSCYASAGCH